MISHDWGSTAVWVRDPGQGWANTSCDWLGLPDELVERMIYWCDWLDSPRPEMPKPAVDCEAASAYELALAIDLKRAVGERFRVFDGHGREIRLREPALDVKSYPTRGYDA